MAGDEFVILNNGYRSGDRLTTFPLRMREDDFMSLRPQQLRSYAEVEAFLLRRYERTDGSP